MTQNQIAYNRLLEERRSNMAKEGETKRSNFATEGLKGKEVDVRREELQETIRHNVATESNQLFSNETNRRAQEEGARHNIAGEELSKASLAESVRHNLASEAISTSSIGAAYASAGAAQVSASAALMNAETAKLREQHEYELGGRAQDTAEYSAQTGRMNVNENVRHNTRTENQTSVKLTQEDERLRQGAFGLNLKADELKWKMLNGALQIPISWESGAQVSSATDLMSVGN